MKAEGLAPAAWVNDMLASESKSFYTIKEGATTISTISQHKQKSWTRFIHYSKQHSRKQKCGVIAVVLSQT
jgi:hypothetical protein